MENKEVLMIPFVAHESAMNRMERIIKILSFIILIMIIGITVYLCLPTEVEKVEQEVSNAKNNKIEQKVGK